jgi:hypothetical protein
MALACGVVIPYFMFTRHRHSLDAMTAVWLLPVVAAEVAGASGGLLAPHLADAREQFVMLAASCVLWAYSVPVAFSILAILLLRMALHRLPHEAWRPHHGWRWDRLARARWGCWCWAPMRPPFWPPTGWARSAWWRRASAWWAACCCGALACGGWRWRC